MPVIEYVHHPMAHIYLLSIVGSDGLEWGGDPLESIAVLTNPGQCLIQNLEKICVGP